MRTNSLVILTSSTITQSMKSSTSIRQVGIDCQEPCQSSYPHPHLSLYKALFPYPYTTIEK